MRSGVEYGAGVSGMETEQMIHLPEASNYTAETGRQVASASNVEAGKADLNELLKSI